MAPHAAPRESMNSGELPPEGDGAGGGSIGARGDIVVTDSARVVNSDPAPPVGEELATYPQALLSGGIRSIGPEKNSSSSLVGAREEKEGGSGGEERKPLPRDPGALEPGWAHALESAAWCKLGRCAYANPEWRSPDRYLAATGCDGYQASRSAEADGRVTVRWGHCPRHREWWRHERVRRARERQRP